MPSPQGSLRIFRVSGIDVYIHWSWLVLAYFVVQSRARGYDNPAWGLAEWLAVFGIVLLHEFGHAFACRSVGGTANRVVLWPLGGVAYVNAPPRPGAQLWSIVAGPLVNVLLVPLTLGLYRLAQYYVGEQDVTHFTEMLVVTNLILLGFNLLPIYPLDGGQILQALLWFVVGRAASLFAVSIIGIIGAVGVALVALSWQSWWLGIIAVFIVMRAINGFQAARALMHLGKLPRHEGLACPACGAAPIRRPTVLCSACRQPWDVFETGGVCPHCGSELNVTTPVPCLECSMRHPLADWFRAALPAKGDEAAEPH